MLLPPCSEGRSLNSTVHHNIGRDPPPSSYLLSLSRRLKCNSEEASEAPDWPYFKAIETILSKPPDNGRLSSFEFHAAAGGGPSTSSTKSSEGLIGQGPATRSGAAGGLIGFLPAYTGSSDEMEMKQEVIDSLSSDSVQSLDSRRVGEGSVRVCVCEGVCTYWPV